MSEILDRIGIYDFFGVLFPGIIAGVVGFYYYPQLLDFFYENIQTDVLRYFFFFVYAYLFGQVLHEVGFYIEKKWMFRKGEPQDIFLDQKGRILSDSERETYVRIFEKGYGNIKIKNNFNNKENRLIFNYCIQRISKEKMNNSYEKMQALYGMARCLYTLFGANTFVYLIYLVYSRFCTIHVIINLVVSLILCILFYFRAKRYANQKVKMAMRTFLVCANKKK